MNEKQNHNIKGPITASKFLIVGNTAPICICVHFDLVFFFAGSLLSSFVSCSSYFLPCARHNLLCVEIAMWLLLLLLQSKCWAKKKPNKPKDESTEQVCCVFCWVYCRIQQPTDTELMLFRTMLSRTSLIIFNAHSGCVAVLIHFSVHSLLYSLFRHFHACFWIPFAFFSLLVLRAFACVFFSSLLSFFLLLLFRIAWMFYCCCCCCESQAIFDIPCVCDCVYFYSLHLSFGSHILLWCEMQLITQWLCFMLFPVLSLNLMRSIFA